MPKLHQQVSIDTILDQDKENLRSRSKIKFKWAKNTIFYTVYRITFAFTHRLFPNCTSRCASAPAWIKIKKTQGQDEMGQKLDFSDGVSHNFFIYQWIMPKLHQQASIDTSLDQGKENSGSRSMVKFKWDKNSIFFRWCTA